MTRRGLVGTGPLPPQAVELKQNSARHILFFKISMRQTSRCLENKNAMKLGKVFLYNSDCRKKVMLMQF